MNNVSDRLSSQATGDQVAAYDNNQLIEACGPLLGPVDVAKRLMRLPALPRSLAGVPNHVRWHQLMAVCDLHIPSQVGIDLAMTMDLVLRQGYTKRQPQNPATWSYIYGIRDRSEVVGATSFCASAVGSSGTGKTATCERALAMYPQVVDHPNFPHLVSPFRQLLWLKVDVPASGRLVDLATVLMEETDQILEEENFKDKVNKSQKRGQEMWNAWCQKAKSNFLGVLVLDEIQNLFRVESLEARRRAKKAGVAPPELRIVDDEALKNILTFMNTRRIALVTLGTPDGMAAFAKRFSIGQRLVSCGYHRFLRAESADDIFYKDFLFPTLARYVWADEPLVAGDEIRALVHELSGGVQRIVVALWMLAHRCMWGRNGMRLEVADLRQAMDRYLAPLKPAIDALRTQDPEKLSRYEDLLPRDDLFWMNLLGPNAGPL